MLGRLRRRIATVAATVPVVLERTGPLSLQALAVELDVPRSIVRVACGKLRADGLLDYDHQADVVQLTGRARALLMSGRAGMSREERRAYDRAQRRWSGG